VRQQGAGQAQQSWSQDLPLPSGKFKIGHHRFEWTDTLRPEILSANNSKRAVVADVWYPAENSRHSTVAYLDTSAINRAFGNKGLRSLLGARGATLMRSNAVHTHACEDAGFDRGLKSAPIIFFSHGMGMITQLYTTQIEDLVSHGYIVVAVSHPYDAWLVLFSNGSYISFERKQREAAGNTEEQQTNCENKRIDWWAADIRFVLDKLVELNIKTSGLPFAGHLNLSAIGAMGHSSGGRAAARACQLDERIKSCADQDGVAMMLPFYTGTDGLGMKQPFLLFERDRNTPPTDAELHSMKMSRQEVDSLVTRLRAGRDAALTATGGSYRVVLHFDSTTHMSFSDLPLLQAKDSIEAAACYGILQVTCRYTCAFFDKTLLGITVPLYDNTTRMRYIDLVQRYGKTSHKK